MKCLCLGCCRAQLTNAHGLNVSGLCDAFIEFGMSLGFNGPAAHSLHGIQTSTDIYIYIYAHTYKYTYIQP